jgi:hypothetical protein
MMDSEGETRGKKPKYSFGIEALQMVREILLSFNVFCLILDRRSSVSYV